VISAISIGYGPRPVSFILFLSSRFEGSGWAAKEKTQGVCGFLRWLAHPETRCWIKRRRDGGEMYPEFFPLAYRTGRTDAIDEK
jgi:hypothetical protein